MCSSCLSCFGWGISKWLHQNLSWSFLSLYMGSLLLQLWPAAYLGLLTAGCWHGPLAAAALIGFTGPLSAIGSILAGIDYTGLDHVMVFANGGLLPSFGRIIKRAVRLETQKGSYGVAVGVGFAAMCLTFTKLVCLHTPYCNSSPEADRWVDIVAAHAYV